MDDTPKKSQIMTIASVVSVCFLAIITVVGTIGRGSFTPKILDSAFGLSKCVLKELARRVDSGYSETFVFTPNSTDKDTQLLFFAEKQQPVKITINGNSLGSKPSRFRVFIDNTPWGDIRELPFHVVHGDITDKLKFDEPGANIHVLRLVPERLEKDGLIVLDCLVLVYNR